MSDDQRVAYFEDSLLARGFFDLYQLLQKAKSGELFGDIIEFQADDASSSHLSLAAEFSGVVEVFGVTCIFRKDGKATRIRSDAEKAYVSERTLAFIHEFMTMGEFRAARFSHGVFLDQHLESVVLVRALFDREPPKKLFKSFVAFLKYNGVETRESLEDL